ncbi:TPA: hypothetical protein ROY01_005947 [Bacillus toyonensis]|nr:hypothetical protein [Bacillus toyonensis]
MNIISLELVKRQKIKEEKTTVIPIIKIVVEMSGEIHFEVTGEKEVPITWLEKE